MDMANKIFVARENNDRIIDIEKWAKMY